MSDAALREALREARLPEAVRERRPLSGGCIHQVEALTLADGTIVVTKRGGVEALPMFRSEAESLRALAATKTVLVPQPRAVVEHGGDVVLLMTHIEHGRATDETWQRFGGELAALHETPAGQRYGFEADNFLGTTPQPNAWRDDWVAFTAEHRLGHQRRLATDAGRLTRDEAGTIDRVIERLEALIPRRPKPALLHGDLWSGNALPSAGGRIAVIDPASHVGDGWADIAMMRLFGGFPESCFAAYAEAVDDHDRVEQRIAVYQLYHLLNHLNLFGRSYAGQVMRLAQRLAARG